MPLADPLFPAPPDDRIPRVDTLLCERYGEPAPRVLWTPLKQLIYSVISSRTKTPDSHRATAALEERFHAAGGNWDELRDAPVELIEQTIHMVTYPETKAPWLKLAMQQITARYGSLTLDFLAQYRTDKIRAWLEGFEGVGPKVSAAVVNFSTLRRRALCVDSHHLRIAQRLALTPRADAGTTEQRLMRLIPESWDAARLDRHHSLVKLHGQTLCTFSDPRCRECPLLDMCPHGQRLVGGAAKG